MVGVAVGGRVDDDLDAFGRREVAVVEAVLRAQIGGGPGSECIACEGVEFSAVVIRKEDIVVRQREAIGFDLAEERHRRERAGGLGVGGAGFNAERSGGERGTVCVKDNRVGSEAFAVGQLDA
jgi:hypothetical protein